MTEAALRAMEFGLFALMSVINLLQEASKPVEAKPAIVQKGSCQSFQSILLHLQSQ